MKILHTSDWHLGRSLYGRRRYDEFGAFLDWLAETMAAEKVDVLLIAGDIFDNSTPANRAQELYYGFLSRIAGIGCRRVIVSGGNHDSPSFLNAPRQLLKALRVDVVGAVAENYEDEVIPILTYDDGRLDFDNSAIVGAVPYLRDKDIRTFEPGEDHEEKNRKMAAGISRHYEEVVGRAERRRREILAAEGENDLPGRLPIIAMGHLFTAGGRTVQGDGVRELYVGSLAHVSAEIFPPAIAYLALGHLHVPQKVAGKNHFRYSGSPIPMGFGEAGQQKQVIIVEFSQNRTEPQIKEIAIPCFQELAKITGSLAEIQQRIAELTTEDRRAWLEIEYTGSEIVGDLRDIIENQVAGTGLEIRRIKNRRLLEKVIQAGHEEEQLDDLEHGEVFRRCLEAHEVPPEDRDELLSSYDEIVRQLLESDIRAE